jgi:hypothetical protein
MGSDVGCACAKRYPTISAVRSGSDGGDQHREGLTAAGGTAPSRGGEVAGVGAGASYDSSGVARAGQKRRGRHGELTGEVVATRQGQRVENSGGRTPGGPSNFGEGFRSWGGGLRRTKPGLTSAGRGEHQRPAWGHWTGPIWMATAWVRRTATADLRRSRNWPTMKHNWENRAWEWVSHLGVKLGVVWRSFRRAI